MPRSPLPLPARILRSIRVIPGGCWQWQLRLDRHGYGEIKVGGVMKRAHRTAWEAFRGPIPEGMTIDHLCRNRACVNPDHLEPVSKRENTLRGTSPVAQRAAQTHCLHGHPLSGENLYVHPQRGTRDCRACRRNRQKIMP